MSGNELVAVAPLSTLPVDRGVAAVVAGEYVAVFRLAGDEVLAIDHVDPCSGVPVLARGLIGSVGDEPYVASPLHKQRFELRTGRCLDDDRSVRTWPVEVVDGIVHVATTAAAAGPGEPTPGRPVRADDERGAGDGADDVDDRRAGPVAGRLAS